MGAHDHQRLARDSQGDHQGGEAPASPPHDPAAGIESLDASEHEVYTDEEPNALLPDEVAPFSARFRVLYPQHFAMFYLGLITGLRPSTLGPLRRRGAEGLRSCRACRAGS
ncbi:MAG TPA: hypothetical protein VF316_22870 [Polyangiaceae bacterium]